MYISSSFVFLSLVFWPLFFHIHRSNWTPCWLMNNFQMSLWWCLATRLTCHLRPYFIFPTFLNAAVVSFHVAFFPLCVPFFRVFSYLLSHSQIELDSLLTDEQLSNVPVVMLGNKIDVPGAASEDEFRHHFGLFGMTTGKSKVARAELPGQ